MSDGSVVEKGSRIHGEERGVGFLPDAELLRLAGVGRALVPGSGPEDVVLVVREAMGGSRHGGRLERIEIRRGRETLGTFVAKSYPDGTGRGIYEAFGIGHPAAGGSPFPSLIGYWAHARVLLMEEVRGRRLDHVLEEGDGARELAGTGEALAKLHALPAPELPRITLDALLASLQPSPIGLFPDPWGFAREVESWLRSVADPVERRTVLCHRDLHPRQVIVGESGARLVDLDQAGPGHPSLDVANLQVYLESRYPGLGRGFFRSFRRGYVRAGGFEDPGAELVYRVFARLRRAVKAVRERGGAGQDEARTLLIRARTEVRRSEAMGGAVG